MHSVVRGSSNGAKESALSDQRGLAALRSTPLHPSYMLRPATATAPAAPRHTAPADPSRPTRQPRRCDRQPRGKQRGKAMRTRSIRIE